MIELNELPDPANTIVSEFANQILNLGSFPIEGIYLTGSLALSDFFPNKSDIDFIVICREAPDKATISRLKRIHAAMERKYPKPDVSGYYLPLTDMQADHPGNLKVLSWQDGALRHRMFEMAPVCL